MAEAPQVSCVILEGVWVSNGQITLWLLQNTRHKTKCDVLFLRVDQRMFECIACKVRDCYSLESVSSSEVLICNQTACTSQTVQWDPAPVPGALVQASNS